MIVLSSAENILGYLELLTKRHSLKGEKPPYKISPNFSN